MSRPPTKKKRGARLLGKTQETNKWVLRSLLGLYNVFGSICNLSSFSIAEFKRQDKTLETKAWGQRKITDYIRAPVILRKRDHLLEMMC